MGGKDVSKFLNGTPKKKSGSGVPAETKEAAGLKISSEPVHVTDSCVFELANLPAASVPPPPLPVAANAVKDDEWGADWDPDAEDRMSSAEHHDGRPKLPPRTRAIPVIKPPHVEVGPMPPKAFTGPPPRFTKLAHVCIYVKNLERSVEFYTRLGFKKRFTFTRTGKLFGAYLGFGDDNFIELFEDPTGEFGRGRLAHFCLETPDIDAAMKALTAREVVFTPKKLGCDATYQIWMKDPDGNDFEIHQYTKKSLQLTGGEVEADW
jgi:lactoylglutathione lyase/glyoxylase I family protein